MERNQSPMRPQCLENENDVNLACVRALTLSDGLFIYTYTATEIIRIDD